MNSECLHNQDMEVCNPSAPESHVMPKLIGEIFEKPDKMHCEWRISDFLSLLVKVDMLYTSPKFYFAGACWSFCIYPNNEIEDASDGCAELYLLRKECLFPTNISCSLGIKKANDGEEIHLKKISALFLDGMWIYGTSNMAKRSDLLIRKSDLAPTGTLTVTCTLVNEQQYSTDASLFERLWNMSRSLRKILSLRNRSDVVLKLKDGEIPAHQVILQARSPVFNRMFDVDMREYQTGEVNVEDAEKNTFDVVLDYAYSGVPESLSSENVCAVFKISHKYKMKELTNLCKKFMQERLSVDTVCDVIALANVYQETELKKSTIEYLASNVSEVAETEKWRTFKRENTALVSELLESIVLENATKAKISKETKQFEICSS